MAFLKPFLILLFVFVALPAVVIVMFPGFGNPPAIETPSKDKPADVAAGQDKLPAAESPAKPITDTQPGPKLDLKTKMTFFKDIVAAQNRSMDDAEKIYSITITDEYGRDNPDFTPENIHLYSAKAEELRLLYEKEVRDRYGYTLEQQTEIIDEGIYGRWPMR